MYMREFFLGGCMAPRLNIVSDTYAPGNAKAWEEPETELMKKFDWSKYKPRTDAMRIAGFDGYDSEENVSSKKVTHYLLLIVYLRFLAATIADTLRSRDKTTSTALKRQLLDGALDNHLVRVFGVR